MPSARHEEALGVVRDLGLRDEVPFLLADLGDLHVHLGDFETAAVLHKEALDLALDLGAGDAAALARSGLALAARRQGDYGRARDLYLPALSFYREAARPSIWPTRWRTWVTWRNSGETWTPRKPATGEPAAALGPAGRPPLPSRWRGWPAWPPPGGNRAGPPCSWAPRESPRA